MRRPFKLSKISMCGTAMAALLALSGGAEALTTGYVVLHAFKGTKDGNSPQADLLQDSGGNLFGTTVGGGGKGSDQGDGTVFKVAPDGTTTILHAFSGNDGSQPFAAVIADANGNLYGTTNEGGTSNEGVVFKLAPDGTYSILHSFTGGLDGGAPLAGLLADGSGNFYGTTFEGGANDAGAVFKLAPDGTETVLYNFTGGTDGAHPVAALIADGAGNLYGTALGKGAYNGGVAFRLAPNGTYRVLHAFGKKAYDGTFPYSALVADGAGNLYCSTYVGGKNDEGTVVKIMPDGRETVLYAFRSGSGGRLPYSDLTLDHAGNLYGTTFFGGKADEGVVYRITPSGDESVVHAFSGDKFGELPVGGVVMDASGNLFGTTNTGGRDEQGVVFEITPPK
jgi:uncharacterized repeat protein (TIGR03803 family)